MSLRTPTFFRVPLRGYYVQKLPIGLSAILILVSLLRAQQQQPSKEYIRIGGRVIAVENPVATTITVCPQNSTVGLLDVLQFTASTTSVCTPTSPATWAVQDGTGSAAISPSGGLLTPVNPGTVTVQATIGGLSSMLNTVTIAPVFSVPSISALASGQLSGGGLEQFTVTKQGPWTLSFSSASGSFLQFQNANANGTFSGSGTVTVGYVITPNNNASGQTGTMTLTAAGLTTSPTLTVNEAGAGSTPLPPSVLPTAESLPGTNGTFQLTIGYQGIQWWINETQLPTWIHLNPNNNNGVDYSQQQSGNATVVFNFDPNIPGSPNSMPSQVCIETPSSGCSVNVAVSQSGGVSFSQETPSPTAFPTAGGTGTVLVTAPAGTPWVAAVVNPSGTTWLTLGSVTSGVASSATTLSYVVQPNGPSQRSGAIAIGGQSFTVTQLSGASAVQISGSPTSFTQTGNTTFTALVNGVQQSATWTLTQSCGGSLSPNTSSSPVLSATGASVTYYAPPTCQFMDVVDRLTAAVAGSTSATVFIFLDYPGTYGGPTINVNNLSPPTAYLNFELILPGYPDTGNGTNGYSSTTISITPTPPTISGTPPTFPSPKSSCTMVASLSALSTASVYLQNDAGTDPVLAPTFVNLAKNASGASPAFNVPVNSQCEIDPTWPYSSISAAPTSCWGNPGGSNCMLPSTNGLSVNLGTRFRPAFGANNPSGYTIWLEANGGGINAVGPVQLGTWSSPGYLPPDMMWVSPTPGTLPPGTATVPLVLWAVDNLSNPEGPIQSVQVQVDGVNVGVATNGAAPSVAPNCGTVQPQQQSYMVPPPWDCPNIGWYYPWDTTSLANGNHTVTVVVTDSDPSTPHTNSVSETFTLNNPAASAPTFSIPGQSYSGSQPLSLSTTTPNSTIYYTTNGNTPSKANGTPYTGQITVGVSEIVSAIAYSAGYAPSPVASASYTITTPQVDTPVINPNGGTFASSPPITITCGTPSAIIYYTTNGQTPTQSSTRYLGSFTIPTSPTIIQAIAYATGMTPSSVTSATFTLAVAAPSFSPPPGPYSSTVMVTLATTTPNANIRYTTNGSIPTETTNGTTYTVPFPISITTPINALAWETGMADSSVLSATYTITQAAATTTAAANASANFNASSQNVTLSATVTSAAGAVNSGTVTFTVLNGMTVIGSPVTSGTVTNGAASASYSLPGGTAAGSYTIQAAYNPGANFLTSSDSAHTLTVNGSGGGNWYNSGGTWLHRKSITVNANQVQGTQTNFPMVVSLTSDSDLISGARSDGRDILFTDNSGTNLVPFEVEGTYTSGTLVAWVQVPSLSTGTVIYMYYGNSLQSTSLSQPTAVWDSHFKSVWHFANGTTLSTNDSTSLGHNATAQGTTSAGTGQIGGGMLFHGGGANNNAYAAATTDWDFGAGDFTVSGWQNDAADNGGYAALLGRFDGTNQLLLSKNPSNVAGLFLSSHSVMGTTAINDGLFHYVVGSRASNVLSIYVDGALQATTSGATETVTMAAGTNFGISMRTDDFAPMGYQTRLDEVRISNIARTAAWITAEYNNQSSPPTFYSVGLPSGPPPAQVTLTSPANGTSNQSSPVTLSWAASTGATSYDIYLGLSNPPALFSSGVNGTSLSSGTLAASQTYYWNVVAKNSGGSAPASAIWSFTTASSGGGNWYNSGGTWLHRKSITVNANQVQGTQTNFPMVVSLTSDSDLISGARSDGRDILFTDNSGTNLVPFEVEGTYTSGTLVAWVQVPSLSTGTVIYMYYGNSLQSTSLSQPTAVWDSHFKSVWHFANGTTLSTNDSTSLGHNATAQGTTSAGTGQIGGGMLFHGGGANNNAYAAATTDWDFGAGDFTVSGWQNDAADNGGYAALLGRFDGTNQLLLSKNPSNVAGLFLSSHSVMGTTAINDGLFHYVVGSRASNVLSIYVDGALQATTSGATETVTMAAGTNFGISMRTDDFAPMGYQTRLDEVRISNIARTAAWITAEYNNQSSPPTFYSVGPQQP